MIGGEIALALAERGWSVRAVVRADGDAAAAERLRERLAKSSAVRRDEISYIRAVAGDVTLPSLGTKDPSALGDADVLVHCAGCTSFVDDEHCRRVNVGAAHRVVETVRALPRRPRIVFVSTATVCMKPRNAEIAEDAVYGGYSNGYTRSKREAERVLLESGLDVVIVRPSIVLSRGVADRSMARAILWVVPALAEIGGVELDADGMLDIVPVDYVAKSVAGLAAVDEPAHRCYHVSSGAAAATTCRQLRETIASVRPKVGEIEFGAERLRERSVSGRLQERLREAVSHYVPFLGAGIAYSPARLAAELGPQMPSCPRATEYVAEVMAQVDSSSAPAEAESS
jgi:nucleoside-diphosphate-sugar epimerase